ncbi:hypothetical protein PTQ47_30525, partial [Klebsiella michiganensis]
STISRSQNSMPVFFHPPITGDSSAPRAGFFVFTNDSSSCIANIATRQKDEALRSINDCSAVNHEDDNYSPFEA